MAAITVGIDIGGQKTVIVAEDAEIVLTDTGSISRPTLVAFSGNRRLVGEEAAPEASGDGALPMINQLIGEANHQTTEIYPHRRLKPSVNASGIHSVDVEFHGQQESFSVTALLGMYLAKQFERISAVYPNNAVKIAFSLPPRYSSSVARAVKEACEVARFDLGKVSFTDSSDCLVATYGRKLQALRGPEKTLLEGKKSIIIEMGHSHTTVVVVGVDSLEPGASPVKLSFAHDDALGALHFDLKLFQHFAGICLKKDGTKIEPGTKRGQRLLSGCERIRKLLSQLSEAKVTVENLTDSGDVNFTLRRDDMFDLTGDLLARFRALIATAIADSGVSAEDIKCVEIVGGGSRMPSVQAVITQTFGEIPLGAKLDDGSVALGAALVTNRVFAAQLQELTALLTPPAAAASDSVAPPAPGDSRAALPVVVAATAVTSDSSSVGLSAAELEAARQREIEMQAGDAELIQLLAARNELESYILEMRSAKRRKHGEKIDGAALESLLNDNENWMWDNQDSSLAEVNAKNDSLRASVAVICADFFAATEADRVKVEQALEAEALIGDAERAAAADDEDHDNRKLRKPDRMRLVVKNKEEGTELFKGGNIRPAAARYHKSLTHIAKFFDLTPEDEAEIKAIKATLFLNLTSCYLKLENWDSAMRYVNDALALDAANPKAYFRRSVVFEAKKEWEKALTDIKKCQELNDVEDKLVTKAAERIKKEIQKEKEKEKKMWGKAFA